MRVEKWTALIVVIIVGLIILSGTLYTVNETQQVVITQFGDPIGEPITKAGLYAKTPFIQKVNYFDKRMLVWDGSPTQVPTRDKKYIWVDTTARWRIVDALKFLQSVGNERTALGRLDDIIDSSTRDEITAHLLYEIVRNSNREFTTSELTIEGEELGKVNFGRELITRYILRDASKIVPQYGMELIDVRIKRLNYVEEVRQKVYTRMISERKRVAAQYRSEGEGKKAEIEGAKEKELRKITSQAYRQAQEIKGKADAKATETYARSYSKDPEFYSFIKTLESYSETLDENSWLILTSNSDFFKYLKSMSPK